MQTLKAIGREALGLFVADARFTLALVAWIAIFIASGSLQRGPSPKRLGGDFALFIAGARVMQVRGNPYNQRVLYRMERRVLTEEGISPPAYDPYMRVGSPPLFLWALQPLACINFATLQVLGVCSCTAYWQLDA